MEDILEISWKIKWHKKILNCIFLNEKIQEKIILSIFPIKLTIKINLC